MPKTTSTTRTSAPTTPSSSFRFFPGRRPGDAGGAWPAGALFAFTGALVGLEAPLSALCFSSVMAFGNLGLQPLPRPAADAEPIPLPPVPAQTLVFMPTGRDQI